MFGKTSTAVIIVAIVTALTLGLSLFAIAVARAAQPDWFENVAVGLSDPASDAFSPTLADTGYEPAGVCRAFIAETAGTVKVTTLRGRVVTFTCYAGQQIDLRVKLFWSTGTTSTVKCLVRSFGHDDLYRKVSHDAAAVLA